jgi:hydroxymethylbilane synthase
MNMQKSVANQAVFNSSMPLRLGTRTSQLALWQTNYVISQLQSHWPQVACELVHMVTQGDRRLDRPLPEIGGKGLFTAELEEALRQGEIDLAVHSLKDLPVEDSPGLMLGAILSREDTRDVLIAREGWTLATLPEGAVVGTSSLRRQAQLLALRPDLDVRPIRGNVDTRLRKVLNGAYHAAVMAGAGFLRLGLTEYITEWLPPTLIMPAPGQGALAIQCRADDERVKRLLSAIHDPDTAAATKAERQVLWRLGGGCSAPVGAWAQRVGDQFELQARVATVDGQHVFNAIATGSDPYQLADRVAGSLLGQGAHIALNREARIESLPLAGKRVVVTRAAAQADDLSTQLRSAGAEPIEIPMIQIVPVDNTAVLDAAIKKFMDYDWIIFTSPNAVELFYSHLENVNLLGNDSIPKIAAVGPATQKALQAHGSRVDAMPAHYLGTEIVATLGDIQNTRILLPRSAQGGRELPDALAKEGATVEEIALYTPAPATLDEAAIVALTSGVDAVTFASGSAVSAFVAALRNDHRLDEQLAASFWSSVTVACIGPTTADVARSEGLTVHVVASEHTIPGLVAALVNYYEQEGA